MTIEPGTIAEAMKTALDKALNPSRVEFADDSRKHAGHAGHDGLGESHFRLTIVAECFEGQNRAARHRMVYSALETFLKTRVHALSIKALTPAEDL